MSVTYTEKVTITRERTKHVSGKRSGQKSIGSGNHKPRHSGWHKEFYGQQISRQKYYEILEKYDSFKLAGKSDSLAKALTAIQLEVSEAKVAAVVQDR